MVDRIKRVKYYFLIWLTMSKNAFLVMLSQKKLFVIFLLGKAVRFIFFGLFIFYLVRGTGNLAGYSVEQTMFFFLTFNLVDIVAQFLFREVYRFRPMVVSGSFDLVLSKPTNALFRVLMGGADVIDLVTIPPLIAAIIYVGGMLNPTTFGIISYIVLIVNALIIASAFHIAVLSLAIITLEIDHSVMIYRDIFNLGRFPIEIYREPLRSILTFLLPVAIMVTLPSRALMGLTSPYYLFLSLIIGFIFIFLALKFWNRALRYYTSASS